MSESFERREAGSIVDLMRDRMDGLERAHERTLQELSKHITECGKNYKYLMWAITGMAILHSPDAVKILLELAEKFK